MIEFNPQTGILKMSVKKSPMLILVFLYLVTFITFLLPILGFVLKLISGKGLGAGNFVALGLLWIVGYFSLRISLWNTFGKEELNFQEDKIEYIADYGWYKGDKKEYLNESFQISITKIGYEEDNKGVLHIQTKEQSFNCVSKHSYNELTELVPKIEAYYKMLKA